MEGPFRRQKPVGLDQAVTERPDLLLERLLDVRTVRATTPASGAPLPKADVALVETGPHLKTQLMRGEPHEPEDSRELCVRVGDYVLVAHQPHVLEVARGGEETLIS